MYIYVDERMSKKDKLKIVHDVKRNTHDSNQYSAHPVLRPEYLGQIQYSLYGSIYKSWIYGYI